MMSLLLKYSKSSVKCMRAFLSLLALMFADIALATDDLSTIAENLGDQVNTVATLLVVVAFVAGVGFALAGIVQFKAHKDNPTQVPLSKPIVYVCISAALLFLPSIMGVTGQTIFGDDREQGSTDWSGTIP